MRSGRKTKKTKRLINARNILGGKICHLVIDQNISLIRLIYTRFGLFEIITSSHCVVKLIKYHVFGIKIKITLMPASSVD